MKEKLTKERAARAAQRAIYAELPIVYSCSGASNAAQLTNSMAVRLDRSQLAEMSCIAGVGGDVKPLVNTASSGRPILVLDGCPLHCAKHSLARHGIQPTQHIDLSTQGIKKVFHEDVAPEDAERIWNEVVLPAAEKVAEAGPVAKDGV